MADLESISGDEDLAMGPPQPQTSSKQDLQRARELYAELQQVCSTSSQKQIPIQYLWLSIIG